MLVHIGLVHTHTAHTCAHTRVHTHWCTHTCAHTPVHTHTLGHAHLCTHTHSCAHTHSIHSRRRKGQSVGPARVGLSVPPPAPPRLWGGAGEQDRADSPRARAACLSSRHLTGVPVQSVCFHLRGSHTGDCPFAVLPQLRSPPGPAAGPKARVTVPRRYFSA